MLSIGHAGYALGMNLWSREDTMPDHIETNRIVILPTLDAIFDDTRKLKGRPSNSFESNGMDPAESLVHHDDDVRRRMSSLENGLILDQHLATS